jgi:hypothetical protein
VTLAFIGPFPPRPQTVPPTGGLSFIDSIHFIPAAPELIIEKAGNDLTLSWPSAANGYVLQQSDLFDPQGVWSRLPGSPELVDARQRVRVPASGSGKFFRLGLE